jgi:hypothetical protein
MWPFGHAGCTYGDGAYPRQFRAQITLWSRDGRRHSLRFVSGCPLTASKYRMGTRDPRVDAYIAKSAAFAEQAIALMADGKPLKWKYMRS